MAGGRRARGGRAGRPSSRARPHRRGGDGALPRGDRRGRAGVRGGQAAARLLRAARRARLGGARAGRRDRARPRPARAGRRQARRRARHRRRLRPGARGRDARRRSATWPGLGADAFTANPLLGRDALEPLVEAAAAAGAGCFVLVRTSNPGAAELQDSGEPPLHERLARARGRSSGASRRGECGLSLVGAVTGATRPEHLGRLRELMPHAIFLLPGVGAQGGRVEDLGPAFAPHPAAGLVDRLALDRERARRARRRPGRGGRRGGRGAAGGRLGALAQSRPRARFGPILNGPR